MIKIIKILNVLALFIAIIFTTSCKSLKDGLSGRKQDNSDEFLVQKKNPLILPPDYEDLPKPSEVLIEIEEETSGDLLKIIKKIKENKNISEPNKSGSIEDFVLKKIK